MAQKTDHSAECGNCPKIKRKSEAALILEKFSEGHLEVFELCNEYLHKNKAELATVGVGSPRLAAFRLSREVVREMHKKHLLNWAEIESRENIKNAKNQLTICRQTPICTKSSECSRYGTRILPARTAVAGIDRSRQRI